MLRGPFDSWARDLLVAGQVRCLVLGSRHGWPLQKLDFLHELSLLEELVIQHESIEDLSSLAGLPNLRQLLLECPKARLAPNFSLLPKLADVRLDWRSCFFPLLCSNTLKTLLLDKYDGSSVEAIRTPALERLEILRARRLSSLSGIENLTNLEEVNLYQCSRLLTVASLSALPIRRLQIKSCNQVDDIAMFTRMRSLEKVEIEGRCRISSVYGVSQLEIRKLRLVDVDVEDGELGEVALLRSRNRNADVFFTNKRHYSHHLVYDRAEGAFVTRTNPNRILRE